MHSLCITDIYCKYHSFSWANECETNLVYRVSNRIQTVLRASYTVTSHSASVDSSDAAGCFETDSTGVAAELSVRESGIGGLILLSNINRPRRLIELSNVAKMTSRTLAEYSW